MQTKKFFAIVLTVVLAIVFSVPCLAYSENRSDEVKPLYTLAINPRSYITVSGTTAYCESRVNGLETKVSSISVVQTLQKHWAFGIYSDVQGATWSKSVNGTSISISKTKTGLESGTYRVKAVFTLTAKDGTSETITVYSDSKVI